MSEMERVYQCEDSVNGVLSAIYDAGMSGKAYGQINIEIQKKGYYYNTRLFAEYFSVQTEEDKVEKVLSAVKNKISYQAYAYIMQAVLSDDEERGNIIYRFLLYGFKLGAKVCDALQIEEVQKLFELYRKVSNEAHYYKEFLRFKEVQLKQPILIAKYSPKSRVTVLIAEHFADRLNIECFLLYDASHGEVAIHEKGGQWYLKILSMQEKKQLDDIESERDDYSELWNAFFQSIGIKQRENKNLQRNNLPLRYRDNMTEFIS